MTRRDEWAGRFRQALAVSGRSQKEVAADLGASETMVSRWARGAAAPSLEYLAGLPAALGVSGHWLLTGEEPMRVSEGTDDAVRLRVIGRIVDGELSDEVLRILANPPDLAEAVTLVATTREIAITHGVPPRASDHRPKEDEDDPPSSRGKRAGT